MKCADVFWAELGQDQPSVKVKTMDFKRNHVERFEMDITPRIAEEMLKCNVGNRKVRRTHVAFLKDSILRGEWCVTHQGIAFDKEGILRDGQNRLLAVVASDKAVRMVVSLGLDPATFDVVDRGLSRNTIDVLGGERYVADPLGLAACILAGASTRVSAPQLRKLADSELGEILSEIGSLTNIAARYFSTAPVRLAAAVTILLGGNRDYVVSQHLAMLRLEYNSMTPTTQAFVRQASSVQYSRRHRLDVFCRAMRAFDASLPNRSRILIKTGGREGIIACAREVLRSVVGDPATTTPADPVGGQRPKEGKRLSPKQLAETWA